MQLAISVVIPTLNEETFLGKCLQALTQSVVSAEQFEVIVVDNGSVDLTRQIAESFAGKLNLSVLCQPNVSISRLRNIGSEAARGAVLAFLDADCIPPVNWLSVILHLTAEQPEVILGADYLIPQNSSWVARLWYGHASLSGPMKFVPAGDLVIARSVFLRLGGFDESIRTNEDCELCFRARASGVPVIGRSELSVVHLGTPQTLMEFYRKHHWHGTSVATVFFRSIGQMQNLLPVAYAFYTLLCLAGIFAGLGIELFRGTSMLLRLSLLLLFAAPLSLAISKNRESGSFASIIPKTVLHLTFGVARALALVRVGLGLRAGERAQDSVRSSPLNSR